MSTLINALRTKDARTENGAVTHSTSSSALLDLFFMAGASRNKTDDEIETLVSRAYAENAELALKTIFWAGDVRGGAGERRFFRVAINWLKESHSDVFFKNLDNVPYFNRWDSLFQFSDATINEYIMSTLKGENSEKGLLAKWMPREGKSKNKDFYKQFLKFSRLTPRKYRKLVTSLSDTVEDKMSAREFKAINYSHVPSVAFNKYRKAFERNDSEGFNNFLGKVEKGETTVKAGAIFPHDIYNSAKRNTARSINAQWNSLPNYMEGCEERILPVCDTSGSMWGLPMDISVSLGIYISERNEGVFKDAFMTFSSRPTLQYLTGSLTQRMNQLENAHWEMSTNLQATFEEILNKALVNKVPENQMPTKILIISDMEFNSACRGMTNMEAIRAKYARSGYNLPGIVFWNVNSRSKNVPVKFNEEGVGLISGASPAVLKAVLGGDIDPMRILKKAVDTERYSRVKL
jgi:hypothetical protein